MKSNDTSQLVDQRGQPFSERIQRVLQDILPRFRRQFPNIRDEAVITDLLEEAGQRIAEREENSGQVSRLHGFTWVTLRNLAISKLRESDLRVERTCIGSTEGHALLARLQSDRDGPEVVENRVLLEQAMQVLTPAERRVALLKQAEFTSDEIASHLNTSRGAVDQLYFRARHKLRKFLGQLPEAK